MNASLRRRPDPIGDGAGAVSPEDGPSSGVAGKRALRVRVLRADKVAADGAYVLYWMTAARRTRWSFALDHALDHGRALGLPLLVLEALEVDYPHASDRFHRFLVEGMAENARRFRAAGIGYHPYVEPAPGRARGLLPALAERAALVVADDAPVFFLPRILAAGARAIRCRLEAVDGNGLLPLLATGEPVGTAAAFRARLQKHLPRLFEEPAADPLARTGIPPFRRLPPGVAPRWPASRALLRSPGKVADLPIDHGIRAVAQRPGGERAGRRALARFVSGGLDRYGGPTLDPARHSRLSPYLHFGHVSAHEVFRRVAGPRWSPLGMRRTPRSRGWWGLPRSREDFLDELVTWRELGYHAARWNPAFDRFRSLPPWARRTLARHTRQRGGFGPATLERAATDDPLWNAAQRQLVAAGEIPNLLRMYWGKRILLWTRSAARGYGLALHLNDKYALDGRDPNSANGVGWVFGRFDRPWPERPGFGVVRAMSAAGVRRKVDVEPYLRRWGPQARSRARRSRRRK